MPTYQYACTACDERLEAVQSFSDAPLTQCPACGGTLRKVFSAVGVVFKGSGFYKNDSRSGGAKSDGAKSDGGKSDGAKPDGAKPEGTKTETKAEGGSGGKATASTSGSGGKDSSSSSSAAAKTPAGKSA